MKTFRDKTVVITGAASGIGEALARHLAADGARLLLADVDMKRLNALVEALRAAGCNCLAQRCDVAQAADVQALAAVAERELGGADVLVNNAGVALVSPVASLDLADAHWLMNINFWGVVHGCQAFRAQLQARPGRVIVNISSVFAMVSMPTQSIYNASKAAVRAFSDALRVELSEAGLEAVPPVPGQPAPHPVRVLCVHPGGIRTRIAEQARLGDIASVADSPEQLAAQFADMARTSPAEAAAAIAGALRDGSTRLLIGMDAKLGDGLFRLLPWQASAWFSRIARRERERFLLKGPRG